MNRSRSTNFPVCNHLARASSAGSSAARLRGIARFPGAALLLLVAVACSEEDATEPEPVPTAITLDWVAAEVVAVGDDWRYEFEWSATADVATAAITYEWRIDRLLPDVEHSEVPEAMTTTPTLTVDEAADLESDALLRITVEARVGDVVSAPIAEVFGRGQIGPRGRVLTPAIPGGRGETILPFVLSWDSYDSGVVLSASPAAPSGFECKVVDLADTTLSDAEVLAALGSGRNLLLPAETSTAWRPYPADARSAVYNTSPTAFALAVRAVDETSGTETALEIGRNVVVCAVRGADPGIFELDTGYEQFTSVQSLEIELPVGMPLRLDWNVPLYCRYSPGTPIDPEPFGDWAWRTELDAPIVFEGVGAHPFLLSFLRDPRRPESASLLAITVLAVSVDRDGFLIVGDHATAGSPGPLFDLHDASVLGARLAEVGTVDFLDEGFPVPPRSRVDLAFLSRYEATLWHVQLGQDNHLRHSEIALRRYLRSGGRLLFTGGRVSSYLVGNFRYPKNPPGSADPDWEEGSLLGTELGMRDRIVSIRTNGQVAEREASGLVGAVPVAGSSFPELILDPARWDSYEHVGERYRGGIDMWEGLLAGDVSSSPIEAFYTAATFDTTRRLGPRSVGYDDAVIGYRFVVEPEEGSPFPEGRVVVLNFETYYFEEEPVAEAARMSIDWLLEGRH